MTERISRIAKISAPGSSGALPRTRLFRLLDKGRKKPVVWIAGPAGAGKTTLISSWLVNRKLPCLWYQVDEGDGDIASFFYYMGLAAGKAAPRYKRPLPLLTPEYLQGVPTFTRRYFEELFRRLKTPFVVVFDDFQCVDSASFHEMIGYGFDTIPEGISVFVLSRSEPPASIMRLRANGRMAVIGWNDLSFTLKEYRDFLKGRDGRSLSADTIRQLHKRTDGWAAGLVLMTEIAGQRGLSFPLISELSQEAIFNYFANEIFEKAGGETRDFLLKTSFLTTVTAKTADKLIGNVRAHMVLSELYQNNYFTTRRSMSEPVFQYHPLFRDFLKSRAETIFDPGELNELIRRTASVLEAANQIEEAAELFKRIGEMERLEGLILRHAQGLVSQGRFGIVLGWLEEIPLDRMDSDPWLLYWKGVCKLLSGILTEGRFCFERAFRLFIESADEAGSLLSWAGVVETIVYTWDDFKPLDEWIEWFEEHVRRKPLDNTLPGSKAAACMVTALYFRKFQDPGMEKWIEWAISLAKETGDVNLMMQAYLNAVWYFLYTDVPRCRVMLEQAGKMVELSGSPFMKVNLKGLQAVVHSSYPGWGEDAIDEILEALNLSREQGICFYDHILLPQAAFAFLNRGETERLAELIEKIRLAIPPNMRNLQACYHMLAGWERLISGDVPLAVAHAQTSLRFSVESGSPCAEVMSLILVTQVLHDSGDRKESLRQLTRARKMSFGSKNHLLLYLCLLMEALFALDRGDQKTHLKALSKAMTLGKNRGLTTILFWWNRRGMARLCSRAIDAAIEEEHAKSLIRILGLVPEEPLSEGERWPWPIRIRTLGRFVMTTDDASNPSEGKVQQKPMTMLKALVALGGKDVSENRLSDILWPDADGDSAHKSFEMTLLRLRRLMGRDDAVLFQGGLLSLNARLCRVDAQVFEYLAGSAEESWRLTAGGRSKSKITEAVRLSEKALSMHDGPFLPNDAELDCTTAMREKMRVTALKMVGLLGSHWEAVRKWQTAIECYRKGIEIDKLFEDFYVRMMICHERLGQRAEAVRIYDGCRKALLPTLGIEPSAKTQDIYCRIRAGQ